MKPQETRRGFTLVEILVVMSIIVVLSSAVFTSANMARKSARDAKRVAQIKELGNALLLFRDIVGSYPSTTPDGYTGEDAALRYIVSEYPGYLSSVPAAPPGGAEAAYIYRAMQEDGSECLNTGEICLGFVLGATLERNDAPVLTGDADILLGPSFYGASDDCLTASAATPEKCYDVKFK